MEETRSEVIPRYDTEVANDTSVLPRSANHTSVLCVLCRRFLHLQKFCAISPQMSHSHMAKEASGMIPRSCLFCHVGMAHLWRYCEKFGMIPRSCRQRPRAALFQKSLIKTGESLIETHRFAVRGSALSWSNGGGRPCFRNRLFKLFQFRPPAIVRETLR